MLAIAQQPKAKFRLDTRDPAAADAVSLRRFTVEEYDRMIQAGIFDEDEPIELLNGEIVIMAPKTPRHAGHVTVISERLFWTVQKNALVSTQNPFVADEFSEPQPDIL